MARSTFLLVLLVFVNHGVALRWPWNTAERRQEDSPPEMIADSTYNASILLAIEACRGEDMCMDYVVNEDTFSCTAVPKNRCPPTDCCSEIFCNPATGNCEKSSLPRQACAIAPEGWPSVRTGVVFADCNLVDECRSGSAGHVALFTECNHGVCTHHYAGPPNACPEAELVSEDNRSVVLLGPSSNNCVLFGGVKVTKVVLREEALPSVEKSNWEFCADKNPFDTAGYAVSAASDNYRLVAGKSPPTDFLRSDNAERYCSSICGNTGWTSFTIPKTCSSGPGGCCVDGACSYGFSGRCLKSG